MRRIVFELDPLTRGLAKIAFAGAVCTITFGQFTKVKLRREYQELDVYKQAVEHLKANKHMKEFLGEPIAVGGVDLADKVTQVDNHNIKLAVRAAGTKSRAVLYMEAVRDPSQPLEAQLKSLEVELEEPKGRLKLM